MRKHHFGRMYLALMAIGLLGFSTTAFATETTPTGEEIKEFDESQITRDENGNPIGVTIDGVYYDASGMTEYSTRSYDSEGNITSDGVIEGESPTDVEDEYTSEEQAAIESEEVVTATEDSEESSDETNAVDTNNLDSEDDVSAEDDNTLSANNPLSQDRIYITRM